MWLHSFMKNRIHSKTTYLKCVTKVKRNLGQILLPFFMREDNQSDGTAHCTPNLTPVHSSVPPRDYRVSTRDCLALRNLWFSTQESPILWAPPSGPALTSSIWFPTYTPVWHRPVARRCGPGGCGKLHISNTQPPLVLIAEEAEGLMVLGAEALISDLPLDGLQLLTISTILPSCRLWAGDCGSGMSFDIQDKGSPSLGPPPTSEWCKLCRSYAHTQWWQAPSDTPGTQSNLPPPVGSPELQLWRLQRPRPLKDLFCHYLTWG